MSLFKQATNQTAYLKAGILGFEGSGKTRTAYEIMSGLCKKTGKKTLGFYDSEKGSDFYVERAKKDGIDLQVIKSRSFVDLLSAVREAEKAGFGGLIIDSTTHVWKELIESWLRKKGRRYLEISDWGALKTEWGQFVDLYINSSLHIAMLGRAGYTYDDLEDDEGRSKMVKSGTKMKVESETGFEPDLLLEMFKEQARVAVGKGEKRLTKGQGFVNKCLVLKDRNGILNGQTFDFPTYATFEPVINRLALGKEHVGVDTTRNSDALFEGEGQDRSWHEMKKLCQVRLEEIKEAFILDNLSGASNEAIKLRAELLIASFGTSAWTAIENMKLVDLDAGLAELKRNITKRRGADMAPAPAAKAAVKPAEAPVQAPVAPAAAPGREAQPAGLPGLQ